MSWIICPDEKNGLLDLYPGAAAAYSLRNLNGRSGLLSPVVRVRRSSDNTEQDFTAAQVTDGTLTTFCGAGDGFVRTWYDQSGNNRHGLQITTNKQPQIVIAGSLLTKGTKPCLAFTGSRLFYVNYSYSQYSLFSVFDPRSYLSGFCIFWGHGVSGAAGAGIRPANKLYDASIFNANAADDTCLPNEQVLFTSITTNNLNTLYKNSASIAFQSGTPVTFNGYTIGQRPLPLPNSSGIAELILYPLDQSTNRTAIEANINAHYSIF